MPSGSATTIDHLGVSSWLCAGLSWLVRGHGGVCGLYMVDFDVGLLGLVRCFERGGLGVGWLRGVVVARLSRLVVAWQNRPLSGAWASTWMRSRAVDSAVGVGMDGI